MKQNISIKQLNELTLEQKEILRKWWKPKKNDLVCDGQYNLNKDNNDYWEDKDDVLPLLSIGQMIEFLDDNKIDWSIIDGWFGIGYWVDWDGADFWEKKYDNKELCDALWDSCKEVLNKD